MGFNIDRFEQAEFEPRTKSVSVPALADFFDSSDPESPDPCEWTVRGLTANELNKALEAERLRKQLGNVAEAIAESGKQVTQIRDALGLGKATLSEVAKRIEMLVAGSVEPQINSAIAVKLGETFPGEFMTLTTTIMQLTGQGSDLVKPEAVSQETPD